jgi:hypothetical protein
MPRYARTKIEFIVVDENEDVIGRFGCRKKANEFRDEYDSHRNISNPTPNQPS